MLIELQARTSLLLRPVAALAFVTVALLTIVGCDSADRDRRKVASPSAEIVARIDGEPVYAKEVSANLLPAPPRIGSATPVDPRRAALDEAIRIRLFAREAKRRGIEAPRGNPAVARAYLVQELIEEELERREIEERGVSSRQALQYYKEHPELFTEVKSVGLDVIIVRDGELAERLLRRVEGGDREEFTALVRRFSLDDVSRSKDGYLTTLDVSDPDDQVEDEIAHVGWAMTEPGQVGMAMDSRGRYYVLRARTVESFLRPWDGEVALIVKNLVADERKRKVLEKLEGRLRSEARVTVNGAALDRVR